MSIANAWRDECLVDHGINFLNLGTLAPTLKTAFDAVYQSQLAWMRQGPGGSLELREARAYLNMMEEQDKCRRMVAQWLGTENHLIALMGNVTDGINAALQSIDWQPGDAILTTDEEHDALRLPLMQLKQRWGVDVVVVPFPKTTEECSLFAERLKEQLSPRTRMIATSEVSHKTGLRISTNDVVSAVRGDFKDLFVLIDGAHAAGTSPNILPDGVDFYVFPGHKWIFGPVGTGVLWVSERVLSETSSILSGSPMMSAEGMRYEKADGAWRYEYGTRDWSKMVGLSEALKFRQQWTEGAIVEHYLALGDSFQMGVHEETECSLVGVSPLISYPTEHGQKIANELWEHHRVLVKPQEGNIRISLPPWIDEERAYHLGTLFGKVAHRFDS